MVKTITIREDVYKRLSEIKRENESFSELFERLTEQSYPLGILAELRGSVDFKDKKRMIAELYNPGVESQL